MGGKWALFLVVEGRGQGLSFEGERERDLEGRKGYLDSSWAGGMGNDQSCEDEGQCFVEIRKNTYSIYVAIFCTSLHILPVSKIRTLSVMS